MTRSEVERLAEGPGEEGTAPRRWVSQEVLENAAGFLAAHCPEHLEGGRLLANWNANRVSGYAAGLVATAAGTAATGRRLEDVEGLAAAVAEGRHVKAGQIISGLPETVLPRTAAAEAARLVAEGPEAPDALIDERLRLETAARQAVSGGLADAHAKLKTMCAGAAELACAPGPKDAKGAEERRLLVESNIRKTAAARRAIRELWRNVRRACRELERAGQAQDAPQECGPAGTPATTAAGKAEAPGSRLEPAARKRTEKA